tara:strand:- start:43 stop:372 length:330 start_codon:yes stop_codon:yes gene_type:complete
MSKFKDWIIDETDGSNFLKNHTKFFMGYWGYRTPEDVDCIMCGNFATDVHHIKGRGAGGDKYHLKDNEFNLAPLCRECHDHASDREFNCKIQIRLLINIIDKLKQHGRV